MIEKYKPFESSQFKKGRKLAKKQGLDMSLLRWGIEQLAQDIPLPVHLYAPQFGIEALRTAVHPVGKQH